MRIKLSCITRHRRNFVIKYCAKLCRSFMKRYENLNYDIDSNGEGRVLKKLSMFPFSCIFDVGANVGDYALRVVDLLPAATYHAFEIAPPTYEILCDKTKSLKNIIVNNVGLSDAKKEVKINYFPANSTVTSIYHTSYPGESKVIKANVIKGDDYIETQGIHSIDFLKIDVEGAEHLVLFGFKNTLMNRKIEVIQFEYGKANIRARFLLADYYELFEKHGYKIGKIYPTYVDFRDYSLDHEDFIGPNYIAVKKERTDLIEALMG